VLNIALIEKIPKIPPCYLFVRNKISQCFFVQRERKTGEVERARFTELVKLLTDKLTACEERARDRTTKYIHIKSTTVYVPSSELGLSHPIFLASECALPLGTKGWGHTRLRVRGWGSPDSDDWRTA
jgi:hypothetical protein